MIVLPLNADNASENLHIFVHFQGELEIVDGEYGTTNLEIVLEKHGSTQASVDNIIVNQTLFDIGLGTISVIQLVSGFFFYSSKFLRLRTLFHMKLVSDENNECF